MKILAIETSCDETAIALVEAKGGLRAPKFKILKNLVSSQAKIHAHWGGVVPNLAKREHTKNLPVLFRKMFGGLTSSGRLNLSQIDAIAVTVGPGLEPALWTGVNFTKQIHKSYFPKVKLIGANHLEGHLYSFFLTNKFYEVKPRKFFPAVHLLASGGHTILVLMKSLIDWKKLGETRDDAVGEAFDKVARMLNLPYPGGPEIEKLALRGNSNAINFPRPMINSKNYDFSFSGLKTSVLYYLRDNKKTKKADVAASFQQSVIDVLTTKTLRAAKEFKAKSVMLSGGVAANKLLRKTLKAKFDKEKTNFISAPIKFQTDNALMIAVAAYIQHLRGKKHTIRAQANLGL